MKPQPIHSGCSSPLSCSPSASSRTARDLRRGLEHLRIITSIRSIALICLLSLALTACGAGPIPTQPPQPPDQYLANALDWIEEHSVKTNTVDWTAIQSQALALAPNPQTTTDTYPPCASPWSN